MLNFVHNTTHLKDFGIADTMIHTKYAGTPFNTKKRHYSNVQNGSGGYNSDIIATKKDCRVHNNNFYVSSALIRNEKRLKIV